MIHYEIRVIPHSSLFIGGYAEASGQSDADTAADKLGILLPGSAVKGALRESAVRLVQGAGDGSQHLRRLFGEDKVEGRIRIGELRSGLAGGTSSPELPAPTVRMHVSLDRRLRQAAPQRLFQNRVTPAGHGLRFRGVLTALDPLDKEELAFLRAAVSITDQLGAGRGRGLGLVTIELGKELPEDAAPAVPGDVEATSVVLVLEALEPLQLAGIKDVSNYTASKDYLDGSVLRGAMAARLPESFLESIMGGISPVLFSDARPGGVSSIPAPLTLNEPKGGGPLYDEAAVLAAEALTGRRFKRPDDLRRVEGTVYLHQNAWTRVQLERRTITRAARDSTTGKAAHRKLFSLEVIDPHRITEQKEIAPLCFFAPVAGEPALLSQVVAAARHGLYVGGDRSRGLGRLRLCEVLHKPPLPGLKERHDRWAEWLGRFGVPQAEAVGVLLALAPLAIDPRRLRQSLALLGLELMHGVSRRQIHGGWNGRMSIPRSLSSHYAPGSVFVVKRNDGSSVLAVLRQLETEGLGPGRPDGWGRLVACHPIHLDCTKEVSV